jgi:Domain of unknown function (DUF4190)
MTNADPYAGYPPYQGPVAYGPPPARPTSGLAVAALVCGIVGVAGGFCLFGVPPIVAVVLGHLGVRETRRDGRAGHGMALAGLILGYVALLPAALFVLYLLGVAALAGLGGVTAP